MQQNSSQNLRPILPSKVVNHPEHYNQHPSGVECIEIVEHFDFVIGNIIKYAWRAGLKPGVSRIEDLQKCLWYAQRAIDRENYGKK